MSVFCCLKNCLNGSLNFQQSTVPKNDVNLISLDTSHMGHEVVIVKNGLRVCGTGGALLTAPLVQNKSYFEVKLQQSGVWSVGVATRECNLNHALGGHDANSWVLCYDGIIRHNSVEMHKLETLLQEGDILGVTYDHVDLNFFLNGKLIEAPISGIRGTIYPALFVDDGAILDIILENFHHTPPPGFDKIMLEQSLL